MAKQYSKKNDDLEMLLNDSQMPWTRTEGGCHKSTLIKALFFTSILLVLVTVSWFLHYNVFLEQDSKRDPLSAASSVLNPAQCPEGSNPIIDFDQLAQLSKILDIKSVPIPPELTARVAIHMPDIMNFDYNKLLQDKALVKVVKQFMGQIQRNLTEHLLNSATTATPAPTTTTEMSHDDMEGMDHDNMYDMDHDNMDGMDHDNMDGMEHDNMDGMHHDDVTKTDDDGEKNEMDHAHVERQHRE